MICAAWCRCFIALTLQQHRPSAKRGKNKPRLVPMLLEKKIFFAMMTTLRFQMSDSSPIRFISKMRFPISESNHFRSTIRSIRSHCCCCCSSSAKIRQGEISVRMPRFWLIIRTESLALAHLIANLGRRLTKKNI